MCRPRNPSRWGCSGRPGSGAGWNALDEVSHSDAYVTRDARRMRNLVMSDWYQEGWGDTVKLTHTGETSFGVASGGV
jgi:hypothetical protein